MLTTEQLNTGIQAVLALTQRGIDADYARAQVLQALASGVEASAEDLAAMITIKAPSSARAAATQEKPKFDGAEYRKQMEAERQQEQQAHENTRLRRLERGEVVPW